MRARVRGEPENAGSRGDEFPRKRGSAHGYGKTEIRQSCPGYVSPAIMPCRNGTEAA